MKESSRFPKLSLLLAATIWISPATAANGPDPNQTHLAFAQPAFTQPIVAFRFFSGAAEPNAKPTDFPSAADSQTRMVLRANDRSKIKQTSKGLRLLPGAILTADAQKLNQRLKASGQLTIEAWIQPDNLTQNGPARIVTLSKDSSNRNVTLGQQNDQYEVRLRTTKTSTNGLPGLNAKSKSASTKMTHVVFTRSKDGSTVTYINGKQSSRGKSLGNFANWDGRYQFAIGDEVSGGRSWQGIISSVGIFDSALPADVVADRFGQGPSGKPDPELIARQEAEQAARHFETKIAPLFANHCMECHDSSTHEGGLDLSKQRTAFQGGDSGAAIVANKSADSLVWQSVENDDMPHDRPALSTDEKELLKNWIDEGAPWSLTQIDPAIYQHSGGDQRWVQRLTVAEYIQTVQSVTGIDIEKEALQLLPPDLRADGFSNTAYNLNIDLKHIDAWSKLAETIVSRMEVRPFVERFSRRRKFTDNDMADVISKVGEWVLRGPVSNEEIVAYRGITTSVASAGGSFDEAMELLLEAMLQSPRFLYRIENQPTSGTADVGPYELASRLSFIIWGGPPDETLLKAARSGHINVAAEAERMLKSPLAKKQSARFIEDWLNLNRLKNLQPNQKRFPAWSKSLADDMKQETLQVAHYVLWEERLPIARLLNIQQTFTTKELAGFYNLPAAKPSPPASSINRLTKHDLTNVKGRGGLLTHGSILTIGGDNASMVTRGLLVMHELLRGVVKDPPPCVDTTPIPTKPGITQRNIALQRINNASCGGCHTKFEPLAFGLEKFDGIGRYSDKDEHGNELRDDGEILFPGASHSVTFQSSEELMNLLAKSERVQQSLTWKVTQFALGRPLAAEDAADVEQIHQQAMKKGATWQSTMTAIVTSDLVTKTRK